MGCANHASVLVFLVSFMLTLSSIIVISTNTEEAPDIMSNHNVLSINQTVTECHIAAGYMCSNLAECLNEMSSLVPHSDGVGVHTSPRHKYPTVHIMYDIPFAICIALLCAAAFLQIAAGLVWSCTLSKRNEYIIVH